MWELDTFAYQSPLVKWPPVGKLLLTLALLVGSLLSPTLSVPLLVLLIGIGLVWLSCGWKLPSAILVAEGYTLLMMIFSVFIVAAGQGGVPIWSASIGPVGMPGGAALGPLTVAVSKSGLDTAILIFVRALAGFAVMLFFITSTPLPHIIWAIRAIGFPETMAELAVLVYRYSFLILEQVEQMYVAAECRLGMARKGNALRTLGVLSSNLLGRSWDFALRAQDALSSRNYQGKFPVFRAPPAADWRWWLGAAALLAGLWGLGAYAPLTLF
ncbi:MAG: hypothetical protein KGH63_00175 [Candidatus Micrarchaeota archaeon]|nr:hypothetical protein [Candidatus Micrarchaeota archaeon]